MSLSAIIKLLRPLQWVKNIFVYAPLFFSPDLSRDGSFADVTLMFVAFCFVASGLYCLNDFNDRDADKQHPEKCNRPVASGDVSGGLAIALFFILCGTGLVIGIGCTNGGWVLAGYCILTILYSILLKKLAVIDVLTIALGFVLRVYAGALAAGVQPTVWILVCTGMLALFIALTKRRDDLSQELSSDHRASLGGYSIVFLEASFVMVSTALVVSYVVFTTDADAMRRLGSENLYLTIPFVVGGTLRHLQLTLVYRRSGSPTELATRDPGLLFSFFGWLTTFAYLIYA